MNQENTFIEAYDKYADAVFRYCYFRVFDRERAKELMQESYAKAWEYMQKGNEVTNLRAFLYKIAHNLCVNEVIRKKSYSLDEMQEKVGFDPLDEGMSPERGAEASMLMQKLRRLKPEDQELLTLRYINDLSVSEIADMLGQIPNTVTVKIRRALDQLRDKVQSHE